MTSKYEQADTTFVQNVTDLLWDRTIMNMNDTQGRMHITPHTTQNIYPTISITREDIRERTNRRSVRNVVVENIQERFRSNGFQVQSTDAGFNVSVPETREPNITQFPNIRSLEIANRNRIREYENSREDYESEEEYQNNDPRNIDNL